MPGGIGQQTRALSLTANNSCTASMLLAVASLSVNRLLISQRCGHAGRLRQLALSAGKAIYDDPKQRDQMSVNWRWEITQGAELNSGAIEAAQQTRREWQASLTTLFDRYDLLALPACQVYPFTAEGGPPSQINGALMDTYHRWLEVSLPASLGGLPTISLPLPSRKPELAAGIQFMASSGVTPNCSRLHRQLKA